MAETAPQAAVDAVPFWWHSIAVAPGIVTPGRRSPEDLAAAWDSFDLPALSGKSVLDIGAWDGYFSFAAEAAGAARVTALDHYVWSMNLPAQQAYWQRCREAGQPPRPYHLIPGHWQPGSLPGKRGFDTAHRLRGSAVEQVVGDFMTVDPVALGSHDITLFLGVLYHVEDPFTALKRLALLTRELAVIETAGTRIAGAETAGLWEFYEAAELGDDVGNWFAPNAMGLVKACRAAGFRSATVVVDVPPDAPGEGGVQRGRLVVHARH